MRGKLVSIKLQRLKYIVSDWASTMLGWLIFNIVRYSILGISSDPMPLIDYLCTPTLIIEQIAIPILTLGVFALSGYYNHPFDKSRIDELSTTLFSSIFNTLWIYMALLINDQIYGRAKGYELIMVLFLCLFTLTYVCRLWITQHAIKHFSDNRWGFNTIMVGDTDDALSTAQRLRNTQSTLGYNILAHLPIKGEKSSTQNHATIDSNQLANMCRNGQVDQIILDMDTTDESALLHMIYTLLPLNVPIRLAPTSTSLLSSRIRMNDVYAEPFVDITSPAINEFTKNIKRLIDIMTSATALILLSPVFMAVSIAIKMTSPGPVFYKQERIGYHQKPFNIYKFRSMSVDAEAAGPQLSGQDDPRVTGIGHVMRKYRIDELPQFWNILKGDMSLVGPRPEREFYIRQLVNKIPYYTLLQQVRPGQTSRGMGKYGYARTIDEMIQRAQYDMIYLSNM
ncbi:MAG: sugar transferase, partial [Muribaculaceae bacterium]|nr:sugar transferase [Muribaculaceae bacterium]